MKVLITHEESQIVMEAFLKLGHEAYSCDLLPTSGKYTERHLQMDFMEAINTSPIAITNFTNCFSK